MEQKKSFLADRGAGWFLLLPAIAFGAAGLIAYVNSGVTEFTPSLSNKVLIGYGLGLALCAVSLLKEYRPVKFAGYLALLYAFLQGICVQATYIANVFVSIDGNGFSAGFLTMAVCSLLAVAASLAAALLTGYKKKEEKVK